MASKNAVDKVVDALEIRDLNAHLSSVTDCKQAASVKIVYRSNLNQVVNIQIQGSMTENFAQSWNIGSAVAVPAGNVTEQLNYEPADEVFPYMRVSSKCGVAPGSGSLDVYFDKQK
jgi:hypothetical protein